MCMQLWRSSAHLLICKYWFQIIYLNERVLKITIFKVTHVELCIISSRQDCASWEYAEHYSEAIMGTMASQITSLTIVYSTVYSGTDKRQHQSSASLAFVQGIHRWPVNSPHKGPVTQKRFSFDDVIMKSDIKICQGMQLCSEGVHWFEVVYSSVN